MALPDLTPELEAAIREGHATGRSQAAIAEHVTAAGIATITQVQVSRLAKRLGLVWSISPNVAAMNDKIRERMATQRAMLAEQALADAISLRERIWDEYTVVVGTPDGPTEHTLDLPDAKAVNDFAAAVERLVKTHENLTRLGAGTDTDYAKSTLAKMHDVLSALAADAADIASLEPPER